MPIIDELERLADLYDAGELTEAEYRAAKAAIVAEAEGPPSLTRAAERRLAVATIVVAAVIALLGIAAAVLDDGADGADTVTADDTLADDDDRDDRQRSTVPFSIDLPGATLDDVIEADASSSSTSTTAKNDGSTSTTAAAPSGGEAAAKELWAAYKAGDKAAAGKVAVKAVVDSLFQVPWSAPDASFEGCSPSGERVRCVYVHKGERITFTADQNDAGAWMVVAINYTRPDGSTTTAPGGSTSSSSGSTASTTSTSLTIPAA